jgi:hypothetical protein
MRSILKLNMAASHVTLGSYSDQRGRQVDVLSSRLAWSSRKREPSPFRGRLDQIPPATSGIVLRVELEMAGSPLNLRTHRDFD